MKVFFLAFLAVQKLVKEYPKADAVKKPKVNGGAGMNANFDASKWQLQVIKSTGDTLKISLDDIKKMPRIDVIFNFKCIEGWNQVTWWGGVRFSEFAEKYNLSKEETMKYVGMVTPDEKYYVGIDMPSMLQPQTILCYEMNGAALPMDQGYPLRLIIPLNMVLSILNVLALFRLLTINQKTIGQKRATTIIRVINQSLTYFLNNGYHFFKVVAIIFLAIAQVTN